MPLSAQATGFAKVESNGFLRRSDERADSSSTITIGPRVDDVGKNIEGKLEVDGIVQVTDTKNLSVDRSSFTIESTNAYLATSRNLWSKHQISVGRRIYDWSAFDDAWQFGMISPRFIWDPIRPETIGLTGAFYEYKSKHWRVLAYGSGLSIPERGYPLRNENGRLLSTNPFYNPNYEYVVIAKQNLPIHYNVDYPPMSDLLFNPGGIVSVRNSTGENGRGFWVQGMYGYLPVHQPDLAIEVALPAQNPEVQVQIHPAIQRHHLLTLETGYTNSKVSSWISQTIEKPTSRSVPSNWIETPSGPAFLTAVGASYQFHPRWKLSSSFLYVKEEQPPVVDQQQFTIELPGRFPYQRAAKAGLDFQATERMSYSLSFTDDLGKESQLGSLDIYYNVVHKDNALTLNLGSDFFASATRKGYIGQYQGNDRFRGGISYAF